MGPGRVADAVASQHPGAADTLAVPVEEHQGVAGGGGLMRAKNAVGSWSQYAKLVYFLRCAASSLSTHLACSEEPPWLEWTFEPAGAHQQLATRGVAGKRCTR